MHAKFAAEEPKKFLLFLMLVFAMGILFFSVRQSVLDGKRKVVERAESVDVATSLAVPDVSTDPAVNNEVTLLFGGDLQFDRYIRQQAAVHGGYESLFVGFEELFSSVDGIVANLEGPVTDFDSVSVGSAIGSRNNFLFTFSPEILPVLKKLGFVLLNLGNNHILNFGPEGLAQTYSYLENSEISYWGSVGGDTWLEDSFITYEENGITFLFVNYNQFLWGDVDELLAEVTRKKAELQPDFVVVYTHWGTEYQTTASEYYQELARRFVAAGADMIIGSHPHVIQQSEVIDGAPVYYSLGNFVFDQYFEDVVRRGLLLKVTFLKETHEIEVEEVPIFLESTGKTMLSLPT